MVIGILIPSQDAYGKPMWLPALVESSTEETVYQYPPQARHRTAKDLILDGLRDHYGQLLKGRDP